MPNKCKHCKHPTDNPKFCNRACAAKYNNKVAPKRRRSGSCKTCKTPILANRTYCKDPSCNPQHRDWAKITLQDVQGLRGYQANSRVRELARTAFYRVAQSRACQNCGYDKHIEVCHVMPISSFPLHATIAEINAHENLVGLCRNCHWEFDNGLLRFRLHRI